MRTPGTQKVLQPSKQPPFFSVQPQREPAFFSQAPFAIAAQTEMDAFKEQEAQPVEALLQERAIEEPIIQPRLTMGAPGDPYEREADAMADQVVQRKFAGAAHSGLAPMVQAKCSACREDEGTVRRQAQMEGHDEELMQAKSDGSTDVPGGVQQALEGGTGGGAPIQAPVRAEMESNFLTDFSDVRIHTGATAEVLTNDVNAHAFTYGKDIYFNASEYRPETREGQHLLAHELTHVVQQNPGLQRKPRNEAVTWGSPSATAGKKLQAQLWSFGPPGGKFFPGTKIHNEVLPMFANANTDLFIEVSIPGANKVDVDTGRRGIADFYKAKPGRFDKEKKSRTIGINLGDDGPTFLKPSSRMEGGSSYVHSTESAPRGGVHKPRVRGTSQASSPISLGDLKPGNSAESYLGHAQLTNYKEGIDNTASGLAAWLGRPENVGHSENKLTWAPAVGDLGPTELKIPKQLDFTAGGKGLYKFELAVYKDGHMVDLKSGLQGAMFVYPHHVSGIWAYEWLPYSIPATAASGNVDKTLKRLDEEVITPVRSTGVSQAPIRRSVRRSAKSKLRRKDGKFPYAQWQTSYGKWKSDAETSLAAPEEKKKANLAETLVDVDKRTGNRIKLPPAVKERGLGYARIRHWIKFGRIYGWLRHTFDGAYVKLKEFADKIKRKVKNLARRVGSTSFGSWIKAAIKVVFKIFKMVASWTVSQVVDKLIGSLQQGITNNINKLINAATPEGVKSKIEEFEEKKAEYEALIAAKQEELETTLFGDKLELLDKLEKWDYIGDQVSTIATVVEWGVRLLACASPPAIGCLWNLLISALQAAFAMLIQTCWFTKKVYAPVMNAIDDVRQFPKVIAAQVVEAANKHLPLPAGMDPLFAPINLDNSEISVDCGDGGGGGAELTPEREAILELVEEIGEDKFRALLELMLKRGAGPWVLLTAERLAELKSAIGEVTAEQLRAAAAAPESKVPMPIEQFLAGVAKYSKQETTLIREANEHKKGKSEGGGGKEGASGGGAKYAAPIAKQPGGKADGKALVFFSAVTVLPQALTPGGSHPKEMDIYLLIGVVAGQTKGTATIYPVRVKVKTVAADHAEFINVASFYAFYNDREWVEIPKDHVISVPSDRLGNAE